MKFSVVDAHQHFWIYDPVRDGWMKDMPAIQRNFLPADFQELGKNQGITGTVVVQAAASYEENDFLLRLADEHPFIFGVIGWIDMEAEGIEEKLVYYRRFPKMKGFRNLLQGEKQRDSMLNPAFLRGIRQLHKYGFSYDLLILPDQLPFAEKLVRLLPEQRFVIDHLAKPDIRNGKIGNWHSAIRNFATLQNVYCKVSGMVTEADPEYWKETDFYPYLDVLVDCFGTNRLMFGSDWPVCLAAAEYSEVREIVVNYFSSFPDADQAGIFGENARRFYQLD
jgi:L-fuconolactonase